MSEKIYKLMAEAYKVRYGRIIKKIREKENYNVEKQTC